MIELYTKAEKYASEACNLPAFRMVALGGIKEQVAEMLNLIGRVGEIFSTYTKHDISHVNAMLGHLDWLIPPDTQKEMTPTDWLLTTMAIYLHDLGMLVSGDEFGKRDENEAFRLFMEQLEQDPKSTDYLNRAKKMSNGERERFFFQEFIRENHPARIKEWITGRHLRYWGDTTKPIAEAISKMIDPFPARFRENLATVCESHHRDNLNRLDLYPLCQRYGNENAEIANVQYAALILRAVDLLHVTKDRTPSVMYKTVKFSDPKGVEEWDKQRETFAVRHAGRTFDPNDKDTHLVIFSADFTEERPFFALTEYLAWADTEIKQTKRWSDQSREHKDAANFLFPWQGVRGDLRVEGNQPQQMRFEFDRGRLLDLLVGHAIYNDATVAIRELLQNAIDAVRFRHYLDTREAQATGRTPPPMGKVSVQWNSEKRTLVVEDNGTGMDLDIIKFHLMRVGSSFYDTAQFAEEYKGFTPISRFGIGILTCFMISDDIEIVTKKSTFGHRIRMSSVHADYLLRELQSGEIKLAGIEPHGTRVTLIIREGVELKDRSIEDIVRYWIILPECAVEYTENRNSAVSIGFQSPSEALAHYYLEAQKAQPEAWKGMEIIDKHRQLGNGLYDMAIAVQSGWYPEKTFASRPRSNLPAVCVEDIRVSDHLPGFKASEGRSLSALISIRGVRGLRTTVSRSGLEEDEVYLNVGQVCVEMLMEHVNEEINRISSDKGKPLSRGSTAGIWLTHSLEAASTSTVVIKWIRELRENLPLIVMESTAARDGSSVSVVERTLVTPRTLKAQSHFWTIESRLMDSLGIISRDLGRELSLNQFLTSLAPEHADLGHSPVLPDANLFKEDLVASYRPTFVQFSRLYQQTAIKWTPGEAKTPWNMIRHPLDEALSLAIAEVYGNLPDHKASLARGIEAEGVIAVAEVEGDEPNINIVITRIATVLAPGSEVARIWNMIANGMNISMEKKDAQQIIRCYLLGRFYYGLVNMDRGILDSAEDMYYSKKYHQIQELVEPHARQMMWNEIAVELNPFLQEHGLGSLPVSTDFIFSSNLFNATSYWRDWHRLH